MKRDTKKANRKQTVDKAKPRTEIKTNVKAGRYIPQGWSDRNVKENFALVDGLDVLATVLED